MIAAAPPGRQAKLDPGYLLNGVQRLFRLFSGIVSLRAAWFFSLILLQACYHAPQPCRNVITSEEISPNGNLKAVTFRRVCPEEHSISTHVSIISSNRNLPDGNGNVFAYNNEIAIRADWLTDTRLAVYTYADPASATKITRAGSVSIEYSKVVETFLVSPQAEKSGVDGSATPDVNGRGKN
jgi:hypothetical protein